MIKFMVSLKAATALLFLLTNNAFASGHFTSGLLGQYPEYDLNDTYVFKSSNKGYTTFISSFNPSAPGKISPISGKNFGANGLYNLHIALDKELKTGLTFAASFRGDMVEIYNLDMPNTAVSEKGKLLGKGKVNQVINLPNDIRIWTGRGKEPFYGNGIDLAKFNAAKQQGEFKPELFKESGDLFKGSTASFIVVDVPNQLLGNQVKFFTTTSVKHKEKWAQVDRHANVLFPFVFLSDTPAVQEDHGQHRPDLDIEERLQAIINNVLWAVSVSDSKKNKIEYASETANRIMPDVLTYNIGTRASYSVDKLNGRSLSDDAMNTVLSLMMGVEVNDYVDDPQRYKNKFPYIIPAAN